MTITYQLNSPNDIDKKFIDSVKAAFKDMPLRINIEVDNSLNDSESKKHLGIIDEQTIFIEHLIQNDTSFKFLKDEDDIYTLDDLKVKY
jgi:hypothetical protein